MRVARTRQIIPHPPLDLLLARVLEPRTPILSDPLDIVISRRLARLAEQLPGGPPDDRWHCDPPHPCQRSEETMWLGCRCLLLQPLDILQGTFGWSTMIPVQRNLPLHIAMSVRIVRGQ